MITKIGMQKLKKLLMKMAREGDGEWNAILQQAVVSINRLAKNRYD